MGEDTGKVTLGERALALLRKSDLRRWDKLRERGRRDFVLRKGVLGWGGWMYVVMSACQVYWHPGHLVGILLFGVPLWLGAGALWGVLTWWAMERAYRRRDLNQQ